MVKSNRGNLTTPIGAIVEKALERAPSRDSSIYDVVGSGGKIRHSGQFSDDNEAYRQLRSATGNQDKDALYERAVNWEIEQAKLREQRAYDESLRDEERAYAREVLEEQRQYESPIEQVARQRAAGINPDLANGGGGGTSSGSSAQMQIPDTQSLASPQLPAQSKFGNAYDNAQAVFNGINTAANFISTFVGGYSAIADSIIKFRELPSRIASNTAAAQLQNTQANEITELLSGKKVRQGFENAGIAIDNASKVLSSIGTMRDFLTPDSDIVPILSAMGVDSSQHDAYKAAFSEMMKTPAKQSQYANDIVANREAQAKQDYYTSDYFDKIVHHTVELDELALDFQVASQKVQTSVARIIEGSNYDEMVAGASITESSNAQEQQEFYQQQLRHDMQAFAKGLESLKSTISGMETRKAELVGKGRNLSSLEQQELDYINDALPMAKALGHQQLGAVFGIERELTRRKFLVEQNPTYNPDTGDYGSLTGEDKFMQLYDASFNDIISGAKTTWDIIGGVTDRVISAAQSIGMIALGFKGVKSPKSGQTIIDYKPGRKGGWKPVSQREIIDNY